MGGNTSAPLPPIQVDPAQPQPLYEQIFSQLKALIVAGKLPAHTPLPSIRLLAKELGVSVITTTRAYSDLAAAGFLYSVQGKGNFVSSQDPQKLRTRAIADIRETFREVAERADGVGLAETELHALLDQTLSHYREGRAR
ncbi:GntR family transcriptional regulator [Dermabacteraceae bacterium TAE3-ERU27]|nr:GntR family transcriptional regulator [Dermabacteraceae bacterium TAE3-ERU27]